MDNIHDYVKMSDGNIGLVGQNEQITIAQTSFKEA